MGPTMEKNKEIENSKEPHNFQKINTLYDNDTRYYELSSRK